jgi:hypothetical protein
MDGYSVKDAAIVLGIPERRVWELIARGVLSSAPEGPDGMRVFLQPRPASQPVQEARTFQTDDPTPRRNGNGGGSSEMSPFRELLTEFRSLTERYGQALLALGEARGEVAALRTRVELLEARMDLRLPSTRPASTVAWEIPGYPTAPEEQEGAAPEALADAEEEAEQAEFAEAQAEPAEPVAEPVADVFAEEAEELAEAVELTAADEDIAAEALPELIVESLAEGATTEPMEAEVEAAPAPAPEAEAASEAEAEPAAVGEPEPEAEAAPQAQAEPGLAAPSKSRQRRAETRRRKIRGGRTALVGIAEALARAEDPTLAELPGAEEAAEALVALQRDIQAARDAATATGDVATEPEPTADEADFVDIPAGPDASELVDEIAMEPVVLEEAIPPAVEPEALPQAAPVEAVAEDETPAVVATFEPVAAFEPAEAIVETEMEPMEAPTEPAATPEPEREPEPESASKPQAQEAEAPAAQAARSPYSTEVVEPDWFADGDFTWLEAAQADADARAAAEPTERQPGTEPEPSEAQPSEPEASAVAEDQIEPEPPITPELDEAAETPPPAVAAAEPNAAPAADAELQMHDERFVEQDAELSRDVFEPSAEDQAQAEDEARTAIQDAFEEPETSGQAPFETPVEFAPPPAEVAAQPEAQPEPEPEPEPESEAIQDAFTAPAASPAWPVPDLERGGTVSTLPHDAASPPEEFIAPQAALDSVSSPRPPAASPRSAGEMPGEEELMWLGDEFEQANLEIATQGWHSSDASAPPTETAPVLELSDAELSQLAEDEGWDLAEVDAIRSLLGRPVETLAPSEDDAASAAPGGFDATDDPRGPTGLDIGGASEPAANDTDAAAGEPEPDPPNDPPDESDAPSREVASPPDPGLPPMSNLYQRGSTMAPMGDPQWLKGRRGPAANTYRRLRRLFPG